MIETPQDEFLSVEDLDLANLSDEELDRVWTAWLRWAQATNDEDRHEYSHGVFTREPPWTDQSLPSAVPGEAA